MDSEFSDEVDGLVRSAPSTWLQAMCAEVRSWPSGVPLSKLLPRLPATHNGDLAQRATSLIRMADGKLSWEALAFSVSVCASLYEKWYSEQRTELLWAGPSPATELPARRIDQVLYDLLATAKHRILLVTFAAHKIPRLAESLTNTLRRGVSIRLVLEFGEPSLYQLSHDALVAFPQDLRRRAEILYWPLDRRELNCFGKPGKLHAKAAVIDDNALLSSANLTDDAFLRNLELGVLFSGGELPERIYAHFDHLISNRTLLRWKDKQQ